MEVEGNVYDREVKRGVRGQGQMCGRDRGPGRAGGVFVRGGGPNQLTSAKKITIQGLSDGSLCMIGHVGPSCR